MAANIRVGNLLGANKPSEAKYAAKVAYVITSMNSSSRYRHPSEKYIFFIFYCDWFFKVMDITAVFLVVHFGANLIPKGFDDSQ